MRIEPGAYGRLGLSDLFEMREECLREFGFSDVYRCVPGPAELRPCLAPALRPRQAHRFQCPNIHLLICVHTNICKHDELYESRPFPHVHIGLTAHNQTAWPIVLRPCLIEHAAQIC